MCIVGSCLCGRTFSNPEKKKGEEKHKVKYFIHQLGPSLGHKQNCLVTLLSGHPRGGSSEAPGREGACHVGRITPPASLGTVLRLARGRLRSGQPPSPHPTAPPPPLA